MSGQARSSRLGINRVKIQPITPKGRRHLSIKLRIIIVSGIRSDRRGKIRQQLPFAFAGPRCAVLLSPLGAGTWLLLGTQSGCSVTGITRE